MARKKITPSFDGDNKGIFSLMDRRYIKDNYLSKSPTELSEYLGKSVMDIIRFIEDNLKGIPTKKSISDSDYPILSTKPEWKLFKQQFSPEELVLFEHSYKNLIDLFREDITATEEKQIYQAIELEIFMHRNKKQQYRSQQDISRLEEFISDEQDNDNVNKDKIRTFSDQLAAANSAVPATVEQYNKLAARHESILKGLKGTREQRIKVLETSKQNFLGLIKSLEENEYREKQLINSEIMKEAYRNEKTRLESLHVYKDGKVEPPILTVETATKIKEANDGKEKTTSAEDVTSQEI